MEKRIGVVKRKTTETDISLSLNIDGKGNSRIDTGVGFLDHMLTLFARHGLFDLEVKARGDVHVDIHHTNEDVGIALGEALNKALNDKKGICRFGWAYVPMEESLCRVVLDISGRPLVRITRLDGTLLLSSYARPRVRKGEYSFNDARHFLESLARRSGITLHVAIPPDAPDTDLHHLLEALFKALGLALRQATRLDKEIKGIPSSKGRL